MMALAAVPNHHDEPEDDRLRPSDLEGQPIPDHDGIPVTQVAAKLTKTGDGLSESMRISPIHLPIGAKVVLVVPATVESHEYDRVKEGRGKNADVHDDEMIETAVLVAEGAFFVDADLVGEVTKAHMKRVYKLREDIETAKRESRGEFRLPMPEDFDDDADEDTEDPE